MLESILYTQNLDKNMDTIFTELNKDFSKFIKNDVGTCERIGNKIILTSNTGRIVTITHNESQLVLKFDSVVANLDLNYLYQTSLLAYSEFVVVAVFHLLEGFDNKEVKYNTQRELFIMLLNQYNFYENVDSNVIADVFIARVRSLENVDKYNAMDIILDSFIAYKSEGESDIFNKYNIHTIYMILFKDSSVTYISENTFESISIVDIEGYKFKITKQFIVNSLNTIQIVDVSVESQLEPSISLKVDLNETVNEYNNNLRQFLNQKNLNYANKISEKVLCLSDIPYQEFSNKVETLIPDSKDKQLLKVFTDVGIMTRTIENPSFDFKLKRILETHYLGIDFSNTENIQRNSLNKTFLVSVIRNFKNIDEKLSFELDLDLSTLIIKLDNELFKLSLDNFKLSKGIYIKNEGSFDTLSMKIFNLLSTYTKFKKHFDTEIKIDFYLDFILSKFKKEELDKFKNTQTNGGRETWYSSIIYDIFLNDYMFVIKNNFNEEPSIYVSMLEENEQNNFTVSIENIYGLNRKSSNDEVFSYTSPIYNMTVDYNEMVEIIKSVNI